MPCARARPSAPREAPCGAQARASLSPPVSRPTRTVHARPRRRGVEEVRLALCHRTTRGHLAVCAREAHRMQHPEPLAARWVQLDVRVVGECGDGTFKAHSLDAGDQQAHAVLARAIGLEFCQRHGVWARVHCGLALVANEVLGVAAARIRDRVREVRVAARCVAGAASEIEQVDRGREGERGGAFPVGARLWGARARDEGRARRVREGVVRHEVSVWLLSVTPRTPRRRR